MRVRIRGFWSSRIGLALLGSALALFLLGAGVFTYHYVRYARMIDERLNGRIFQNTSSIYAAPRLITAGQALSAQEVVSHLQRTGYAESLLPGATGRYAVKETAVEIHPARDSYFVGRNALRVEFSGRRVARLRSLETGQALASAEIEPELLSNLFDRSREKRRLVRFQDLPKHLIEAVLAAEDRRFFDHPGFDPVRVLGAAWVDLRRGEKAQGASTITMQVARSFFFSTERTWRRKLAETLVALQLEQRFHKEEIFELYANQIYLGNRGSFAIHGFGEAAQAYFGKDVRQLNLAESAFLAGIIRAPNRYSSADRKPDRAQEARDRVLVRMVETGMVTPEQVAAAQKAPLQVISAAVDAGTAPYFVDLVKDHLLDRFSEEELSAQSLRVYTTLDLDLQRAAGEAVDAGVRQLDKLLARRYQQWRRRGQPVPLVQAALVVLDVRTGDIKALIGGRSYGLSQLNRALSRRQPGSAFKPFVYAAAFANAADGYDPVLTTLTTVVDEPTTFVFAGEEYAPQNYGEKFLGTVTLREALTHSLNVATVKTAELVGYGRVVEVARQMGIDSRLQPTPAIALGAYEMTPLEVAAAYTPFATAGRRAEPRFLREVVSSAGVLLDRAPVRTRQVLDPRVAYIVNHVLQDVINRGTGAAVRARGFAAPAGGKTGTSHDGWFVGFTSDLVCVVWVGFDDNRELGLPGSVAAAPIWTDFMKRAVATPGYRNPRPFQPPEGVTIVTLDPALLLTSSSTAPSGPREEVFITGSEPPELFFWPGTRPPEADSSWLSRLFGGAPPPPAEVPEGQLASPDGRPQPRLRAPGTVPQLPVAEPARPEPEKKKGLWRRIFGIFGGGDKEKDKEKEKQGEPPRPSPGEGKSP